MCEELFIMLRSDTVLRSDKVPLRLQEEHYSELQIVNDEKLRLGGEISRKDCVEYINTLLNFNSHVYQEFVYLMKDFKPESEDCILTLKQKVKDLFKGYPDLMLGFNAFLPERHKIKVPVPVEVQSSRKLPVVLSRKRKSYSDVCGAESNDDSRLQKAIDFLNKVKQRFGHDNEEGVDVFQSFLDFLFSKHRKRAKLSPNRYKSSPSKSNADENELQIYKRVQVLFHGHPDLVEEFTQFVPTVPLPQLSELMMLANCETSTPSYHVLPENFPNPASTKRTKLASQVLNDRCVCAYYDGPERKEEKNKLFDWEENRSTVDCAVNNVKSTSKSIKALMEKIETGNPSHIYIEDHLTHLNLKCIQSCYDEQGLKAMDELRKDIRRALPLLLKRLKQLEEELRKERPKSL